MQVRGVRRAALGSDEPYDEVAKRTMAAIKAHVGVRPQKVIVYDAGKLGTASEHKSSRFIDERGCSRFRRFAERRNRPPSLTDSNVREENLPERNP